MIREIIKLEIINYKRRKGYRKCQPDDFRCGGSTPELCIPKEKKCDGYLDCRNGRDEEKCENNAKPACRLDQFRCNSTQRCIEQSARCNYKDDCGDNSDEENCSTSHFCVLFFFSFYLKIILSRDPHTVKIERKFTIRGLPSLKKFFYSAYVWCLHL